MHPWTCALLIITAGAVGGVTNALLTDNGFIMPRIKDRIWCPGFISNVLLGAFSAFASWAFYGSGASIELTQTTEQAAISLRFSALAGAFLVGVAGARWLTSEVDKRLLKQSVVEASQKNISVEKSQEIVNQSPMKVLDAVKQA
jgi:membrane associated rhomboid family serine protease